MSKNSWINHVKAYAKEHNLTYNCAISHAKSTYVKKSYKKKTLIYSIKSKQSVFTILFSIY